jgi:hypothetical protein
MVRHHWKVIPFVTAVAVLAACSGGSHRAVATAGGSSSTASSSSNLDQAFIDYVHCMRDHGVDYPDPVQRPGHAGLSLQFDGSSDSPEFAAANDACEHFLQPVIDMKRNAVAASMTQEKLDALLAYSRCMRDHQIPLLDPDPTDGHISFGTVAGLQEPPLGRRDPLFANGDSVCRGLLPANTPDDGTGPP